MKAHLYLVGALVLASGCASNEATKQEVKNVQQQTSRPVNCSTAEGDLRALAAEKANVQTEMANGAVSIVPVGILVNEVSGTEKARFEIGTGEYNKLIDNRIALIKSTCGIK
jgi:PBP1b-binding outer membrane lipoprotein LpoB